MPLICDSCGTENPPGARFCVNAHCQAYLAWSRLDAGSAADTGAAPTETAIKPSSLHPAGSNRPPRQPLDVTEPHIVATTLTAAPTQPAHLVEPPGQKTAIEPALPPTARRPARYEFVRETKAPVAVHPIEEPTPTAPPGQAATSGKHGLWFALDQHVLAVEPGRQASVRAQVANKGTIVEGVDVRVLGIPEDWVRIEPPRVNLDVGGQAGLVIHLAPPRAAATRAGPAEVEVAVWSVSSPKVRCAEHLRLDVGAFHDLEIEHAPHELTVRRSGEFKVGLRNTGNGPVDVEARPRAGSAAEGKVLLKFEPRRATLPPGGTTSVTVRARAARFLLTGPPVAHDLQIDLLAKGETKPVEVKMVERPLLPRWAPKVLALVALLLAVAVGLAVWSWYKHRPQLVPSVLNQPVDLAMANLSKAGFKGVPLDSANAKVARGTVFQENPSPGVHRHPGTVIAITVSSGAPTVTVSDLSQLTQQQAVTTLRRQGLKVRIRMTPSPSVPVGLVTAQSPAPTVAVPAGSTVNITVSSGAKAPSRQP
jgi:hypothetical protein